MRPLKGQKWQPAKLVQLGQAHTLILSSVQLIPPLSCGSSSTSQTVWSERYQPDQGSATTRASPGESGTASTTQGYKARHRGQDDDETSSQSSTPFIVQGDGSHQPLVNELGDAYSERDSREVFTVSRAPTPTPISKVSRAACIGTKNLFCKWTKSRPQHGCLTGRYIQVWA